MVSSTYFPSTSFDIQSHSIRHILLGTSPPIYRNPHVVCAKDQELCGRACLTPSEQQCLSYSDGSGPIVCSAGDTFCGGQCLSLSSGKSCVNFTHHGDHETQAICNPGDAICGWKNCYSAETQVCLSDQHICSKGQQLCGSDCYTPSAETKCLEIGHWLGFVCKNDERICGGRGCYRPDEKQCFADKGTLCNFGEEVCGEFSSGSCFKRGEGKVCLNNALLCKTGEEACGIHCYNPQEQTCHNADTNLLCDKDEEQCGNYNCYNVTAGQQCFQQTDSTYHAVCAPGEQFCGSTCYQPSKEICFQTSVAGWGKLCPIGSKFCGKGFETSCYQPENGEVCLDAGEVGQFVCKEGEALCGKTCYKQEDGKACLENKIVCDVGEELCGAEFCYNPNISKCLRIGKSHRSDLSSKRIKINDKLDENRSQNVL